MKKIILILLLISITKMVSQTKCTDFNIDNFKINGSTTIFGNEVSLTQAQGSQAGSIWSMDRIDLSKDFTISTELYFGTNDGSGADGIAFVIQPISSNLGTSGGGLGYSGISPSLAVEFDTWYNAGSDPLIEDHIAIIKNGNQTLSSHSEFTSPISLPNIEDGLWHTVLFEWNVITKKIKLTFDGAVKFDTNIDITSLIFAGNPNVYWGLTAATGAAINLQKIKIKNYCVTLETCSYFPDITASSTNLCEGLSATLSINYTPTTTYLWSTAETTSTISVSPTVTSNYWVDITTGSLTCRKNITINVGSSVLPTANQNQSFCGLATIVDLLATGTNIQWYSTATAGTPLPSTTFLVNDNSYYATQTINGCESIDRLGVKVTLQEIQILSSETEICKGETVDLKAIANGGISSLCSGSSNTNFSDWTEIAPPGNYVNIIKYDSQFYLRSYTDVLASNNINGLWLSLGFKSQIGISGASTLLDFDWNNRLQLGTSHNSIFAYDNGSWINNGLGGFGCSGNALTRLDKGRIIVSKYGYLRDLYISDDNGTTWTNVTNVDNDYRDIIVAGNGSIFACGGSNTISMTGVIKSTNNGNSFSNISSQIGISYASSFSKDCSNNLYVVGDNKIFKSINNGESWYFFASTPFNNTVSFSFMEIISENLIYLYGYNGPEVGLYVSNNSGINWSKVNLPIINQATGIQEMKLIDGTLILTGEEGVFAKTITNDINYLWSTGDTTETVSVSPTKTTDYWVDVTTNGLTCRGYITINLTSPIPPTGDSIQTYCDSATVADLTIIGANIKWHSTSTGGTLIPTNTMLINGSTYYASQTINGCESLVRFPVNVIISIPSTPVGNNNQSFCYSDNPTLLNIQLNQTNILWYSSSISTTPLNTNIALADGQTYYASQIDSNTGCESSNRFAVKVAIKEVAAPLGSPLQQFCIENSPKIGDLVLNTNQIVWYDSSINGNVLPSNYLLSNREMVYAESVDILTNCHSSTRLQIQVNVINSELKYYNLITLNNNSSNDKLTIIGIENFPENEIQIFNRYGEIVWNNRNYNNSSNYFMGKANVNGVYKVNNYLPTGTYYFILKYSNPCDKQELKGFFQIDNIN